MQITHIIPHISLGTEVLLLYQLWYMLEGFLYSVVQIITQIQIFSLYKLEQGLECTFPITHLVWAFQLALSCVKTVPLPKVSKT